VIALSEEWLFGIPPPMLIIGLIIGIPLLLWLLSEGLEKFVGAVVQAIYVIFGGKPKTSSKRTSPKDIKPKKSVPYALLVIFGVAWMFLLWIFPFYVCARAIPVIILTILTKQTNTPTVENSKH
jgi:uncharacterized membrane protein YfcA